MLAKCSPQLTRCPDEFEVAIFLTETQTRHSLLYKKKHFRDKTQTKLTSNSSKLVGASSEAPIDLDDGELFGGDSGDASMPGILREESEDGDVIALENIPSIDDAVETEAQVLDDDAPASRRPKRRRQRSSDYDRQAAGDEDDQGGDDDDDDAEAAAFVVEDSDDELFVRNDSSNESEGDNASRIRPPPTKRRKEKDVHLEGDDDAEGAQDDKKKLAMHISYDGFAIYGRVLCLVVKRRDGGPRGGRGAAGLSASASDRSQAGGSQTRLGGQASMENWITSTQVMADMAEDMETA